MNPTKLLRYTACVPATPASFGHEGSVSAQNTSPARRSRTRFLTLRQFLSGAMAGMIIIGMSSPLPAVMKYTSIDTMKVSRDREETNPLTQEQIDQCVQVCASLNSTHITVDTKYEFPAVAQQWITSIRNAGKQVYFRCHPQAWNSSNEMTPTDHNNALQAWIQTNPSFFQSGDILDPCVEPENDPYWNDTNVFPGGAGSPAAVAALNQFIRDTSDIADSTLQDLGITGVDTTVRSTNAWIAQHRLEAATVARLGRVTIDTYPEGTSTDPTACTDALISELQAVAALWPGVPISYGEHGYSNRVNVDDTTQTSVLTAECNALLANQNLLGGFNYWVGPGSATAGGYTWIINREPYDNMTPRPAAQIVANFFANFAVSPPDAPTNLSATAGNSQVSLTWTSSPGATSYNVKRSRVDGGPYCVVASGVTETSFTNTGLCNGTTYFYVVSAVNTVGESGDSNQASATPGP